MSISFSGLASGLDTTSWVESLTALKKAKVTTLEEKKETVALSKETLEGIRSYFQSFRSVIEKVTDSKLGNMETDIFAQNLAISSSASVVTATATAQAAEATYNITVDKLASTTQATSNFAKTVTQTANATLDTRLTQLQYGVDGETGNALYVTSGAISVSVNGVEHGLTITDNDTIATFINKLKNIGVEANFNEETSRFSMNLSSSNIHEIGENPTHIVEGLRLHGVNEGYMTDKLSLTKVETTYEAAQSTTKLSELGFSGTKITIEANDSSYDFEFDDDVNSYNIGQPDKHITTIGDFVSALRSKNIDVSFDELTGILSLNDALIKTSGVNGSDGENLVNALGFDIDIYSKTQKTGDLSHSVTTTEIAVATTETKLSELGNGKTIEDGSYIVVTNSNGNNTTIDIDNDTTLGSLLGAMTSAGLYATLKSDGTVEIAGGTISDYSKYNAVQELGLEISPYNAKVTGYSLNETVEVFNSATASTKLSELGFTGGAVTITSNGTNYIFTIDNDTTTNDKPTTLGEFVSAMQGQGIDADFDDVNGILTIENAIIKTENENDNGAKLIDALGFNIGRHMVSQSTSDLSHSVTTTSITSATSDTLLCKLGEGQTIGSKDVIVENANGVRSTIAVTDSSTIGSLLSDMTAAGLHATLKADSTIEIEGGQIVGGTYDAIHELGLEESPYDAKVTGYALNEIVEVQNIATENTKLSELGFTGGTVTITSGGTDYTFVFDNDLATNNKPTTIGEFVSAMKSNGIDADFNTTTGMLTIDDAIIKTSAPTDAGAKLIEALGFDIDNYMVSQSTGDLSHSVTTTSIAAATTGTLLNKLGTGEAIGNKTVIVENADGRRTTIDVNDNFTVGSLLSEMTSAGLFATMKADSTVEITGGRIVGGTYDAIGKLKLEENPYSAMVTGYSLNETLEVSTPAKLGSKLTDLGVTEGWFEVTTPDGEVTYEEITSGKTVATLISDLSGMGISASLNEETGVLSITGGSFRTLGNGEIAGKTSSNFLSVFFGNDSISDAQTSVISTWTDSQALRYTTTSSVAATSATTLGKLGLTSNGTAIFDVNGDLRTVDVTTTMSISALMSALSAKGIGSEWDDDSSRLTINNAVLNGGTSDLNEALNLTPIIAGKSFNTDTLYSKKTVSIDATESTKLSKYGITNSMSVAERTVKFYDATGIEQGTLTVTENTSIGDLMEFINTEGGANTATLNNGILTITGGYIDNDALENAMGLTSSNTSSYVLGSVKTVTTTAKATESAELGDIIELLGTQNAVSGGYNLYFGGESLDVDEHTSISNIISQIVAKGGSAALSSNGVLTAIGGALTGSVATALGITSTTNTNAIDAVGETMYTTSSVYADGDTKLNQIGISTAKALEVRGSDGSVITTINTNGNTKIGDVLDNLRDNYGFNYIFSNGVISLSSNDGKYVTGTLAESLGIGQNSSTTTLSSTQTSLAQMTYATNVVAQETDYVKDYATLGVGNTSTITIKNTSGTTVQTVTIDTNTTFATMFSDIKTKSGNTLTLSMENGIISVNSDDGKYIEGNIVTQLGIAPESTQVTSTVGANTSSSSLITKASTEYASAQDYMGDYITITENKTVTIKDANGTTVYTKTYTPSELSTTKFQDLFNTLNSYTITATMSLDGKISLTSTVGSYVEGSFMTDALGIGTTSTNVTGTVAVVNTSSSPINISGSRTVKASDTLYSYDHDSVQNITIRESDGTAAGTVTVTDTTTFQEVVNSLKNDYGFTSANLTNGVLSIGTSTVDGRYIEGAGLITMGINVTNLNSGEVTVGITQTSQSLSSIVVSYSDGTPATMSSNIFDCAGLSSGEYAVYEKDINGNIVRTVTVTSSSTFQSMKNGLSSDINFSFSNGVISFNNLNGHYIDDGGRIGDHVNDILSKLNITSSIVQTPLTATDYALRIESNTQITHSSGFANGSTTFAQIGANGSTWTIKYCKYSDISTADTFTINNSTTFNDLIEFLGSDASINNGYFSLSGTAGSTTYTTSSPNGSADKILMVTNGNLGGLLSLLHETDYSTGNLYNSDVLAPKTAYYSYRDNFGSSAGNAIMTGGTRTETTYTPTATSAIGIEGEIVVATSDGNGSANYTTIETTTSSAGGTTYKTYGQILSELNNAGIDGYMLGDKLVLNGSEDTHTYVLSGGSGSAASAGGFVGLSHDYSATTGFIDTFTQITSTTGMINMSTVNASTTTSGSSTYYISTTSDLQKLATMTNIGNVAAGTTFVLMEDLDISASSWTSIGNNIAFQGTFNGNGHTISGLKQTSGDAGGLFGTLEDATVKNLGLTNVNISVGDVAGGISAYASGDVNIDNCYVKGTVASSRSGGAAGGIIGSTISNSSADIAISNVYTEATVVNQYGSAGGIFGKWLYPGSLTIEDSYVKGTVSGNNAGAFLGTGSTMTLTINNCVTLADVVSSGGHSNKLVTNNGGNLDLTVTNVVYDPTIGSVSGTGSSNTVYSIYDVSAGQNPSQTAYISSISTDLAHALGIYAGNGSSYTTEAVFEVSISNSDIMNISSSSSITESTTMADLVGSYVGTKDIVVNDGVRNATISMSSTDTMQTLMERLEGKNIHSSLINGSFSVGTAGSKGYITSMNSDLKTALKLSNTFYNSNGTVQRVTNSDSGSISHGTNETITESTTFGEIGATGEIVVNHNGQNYTVTVSGSNSTGALISNLHDNYGIDASLVNGVLSIGTNNDNDYVVSMSQSLANALHLTVGEGYTYTTGTSTAQRNGTSDIITRDGSENITLSTKLKDINGYSNGNGKLNVYKTNGQLASNSPITIDPEWTLEEFFSVLSPSGLTGSVLNGKITIFGNGAAHIESVAGGSNILSFLGTVDYETQTTITNKSSNTLRKDVLVKADDTSIELSDLKLSGGRGITFTNHQADLVIEKQVQGQSRQTVTISCTDSDSIDSLNTKLNPHGIQLSLDNGTISAHTTSLQDFDFSGEVGSFLMGSYTKNVSQDQTRNTSVAMNARTISKMSDETTLEQLGITTGNISITRQGNASTVAIPDSIENIGQLRNFLHVNGFTTTLSGGQLTVNGNGLSRLTSIDGGSNALEVLGLENWNLGQVAQQSRQMSDTNVLTQAIETTDLSTVKLNQLTDSTGAALGITSGNVYVYANGTQNTVAISENDTLASLSSKLSGYGITVNLDNGALTMTSSGNTYMTTQGMTSGASNILSKLNSESTSWQTRYNSKSGKLAYEDENTIKAADETKIVELKNTSGNLLNITTGEFYVNQGGMKRVETITSETSVADLKGILNRYQMSLNINSDGSISITSNGNNYLETKAGGTDMVQKLFSSWDSVNKYTSNSASVIRSSEAEISDNTYLKDINLAPGAEPYKAGKLNVVVGGVQSEITLGENAKVGDLREALRLKGLESTISNGQLVIQGAGNSSLKNYSVSAQSTNALDILGIGETRWINTSSYTGSALDKITVSTNNVAIDRETKLSELGITAGEYYIYNNGVKNTALISSDETVGSFLNTLQTFGIQSSLTNNGDTATIRLIGRGNTKIEASASDGASNVVSALFPYMEFTNSYSADSVTTTTSSNRDISDSTFLKDIVLDPEADPYKGGKLVVVKNGISSEISIGDNATVGELREALRLKGFESAISGGQLLLQATGDSRLENYAVTAEATNVLDILGIGEDRWVSTNTYNGVALNTISTSTDDVAIDRETKLSELGVTAGEYYVYNRGERHTALISSDDTVGTLLNTLQGFGIQSSLITTGDTAKIRLIGSGDTRIEASSSEGASNIVTTMFPYMEYTNNYTADSMQTSSTTTPYITDNTYLKDITLAPEAEPYTGGKFTIIKNGISSEASIGDNATVGELRETLRLNGFETVLSNGQLLIQTTGDSRLENYAVEAEATNALDILGIGDGRWINTSTYDSSPLNKITTTTTDVAIDRTTKLGDLGITGGEYYIYVNGVKYTALLSSSGEDNLADETVGAFLENLQSLGLQTSLNQSGGSAVITIKGLGDTYIAQSNSVTNASNITNLFTVGPNETNSYISTKQKEIVTTTTPAITEETLLSEIARENRLQLNPSDVNKDITDADKAFYSGNLIVTVDGANNVVSIDGNDSVGSVLDKFRSMGLEASVYDGKIIIESGYKTLNIENASTSAFKNLLGEKQDDLGNYSASEDTLTYQYDETLYESVSNFAGLDTKLSDMNIVQGSFTVYRNNVKGTVNIGEDWTFGDIENYIHSTLGFTDLKFRVDENGLFENGCLELYSTNEDVKVKVGASNDTSNFLTITGIQNSDGDVAKSTRELYAAHVYSKVMTNGLYKAGNVSAGTFTVGDAQFEIDENTTMNDIVSMINNSVEAQATAYWDNIDGKLVIQSRKTGGSYINIESGTSNFTDIMGLTSGYNSEDKALNIQAQKVGENAKFTINGTSYTSASNIVGEDVSRIKGVTLNLNGLSAGAAVTITVEKDVNKVTNAMQDIVDAYNSLMENVDKAVASDGQLKDQTMLKMIRNRIRDMMINTYSDGLTFKNLDAIGICLSQASAGNVSTSNSSIVNLSLDKDKFAEAYKKDRTALKSLLMNEDYSGGILIDIENYLDNAVLGAVSGYFDSTSATYNKEITSLNDKIKKANTYVARYREQLEKKFSAMDMMIAKMQQQYTSFLNK